MALIIESRISFFFFFYSFLPYSAFYYRLLNWDNIHSITANHYEALFHAISLFAITMLFHDCRHTLYSFHQPELKVSNRRATKSNTTKCQTHRNNIFIMMKCLQITIKPEYKYFSVNQFEMRMEASAITKTAKVFVYLLHFTWHLDSSWMARDRGRICLLHLFHLPNLIVDVVWVFFWVGIKITGNCIQFQIDGLVCWLLNVCRWTIGLMPRLILHCSHWIRQRKRKFIFVLLRSISYSIYLTCDALVRQKIITFCTISSKIVDHVHICCWISISYNNVSA